MIPVVAKRYASTRDGVPLEVWKPNRHVRTIQTGTTLRIQTEAAFLLHWTADEWQTIRDSRSSATTLGIHWLDIPIAASQSAPIRFTFFFPKQERWEGRDYVVNIRPTAVSGPERLTEIAADGNGSAERGKRATTEAAASIRR
jgi:glucoamylase